MRRRRLDGPLSCYRPFELYLASRPERAGPIIRPNTASKSFLGNGLLRTGAPTSRMNCA